MPQYPIHGSKYFDIREFVDEKTWRILGIKAACLIDPAIVRVADLLRLKVGVPVYVNTWHTGGEFSQSGFRPKWSRVGGDLSQHRCGRAVDVKVSGMTPKAVHGVIMAHSEEFEAAGLTTLENLKDTPTWSHLDCRPKIPGWHQDSGFLIVRPV